MPAYPGFQLFEQVGRRVRKGAKHDDLAVLGTEAVDAGVTSLLFNDLAQLGELGIALRVHCLGVVRQQSELLFVGGEVLQPGSNVQVRHFELELAADLKGLRQIVVFLLGLCKEVGLDSIGLRGLVLVEAAQPLFEVFDLGDGAFHRDREGAHGTFQPLQEVDLHHADQELFSALLREVGNLAFFVLSLELLQHVLERVEERELVVRYLVVQAVIRKKAPLEINF